jgi:hypothetical protein
MDVAIDGGRKRAGDDIYGGVQQLLGGRLVCRMPVVIHCGVLVAVSTVMMIGVSSVVHFYENSANRFMFSCFAFLTTRKQQRTDVM